MTSQELMDEFYNQPLYMSYSALNKLIYSPRLYHKDYILKQKEEEHLPHLIEGKLTHCLLLEEDKFNEQFVIAPMNLPSDNAMKVIEAVYRIHIEAPFDSNGNKKTIGSYGSEIISIFSSGLSFWLLEKPTLPTQLAQLTLNSVGCVSCVSCVTCVSCVSRFLFFRISTTCSCLKM